MAKRVIRNSPAAGKAEEKKPATERPAAESWYRTLIENLPQKIFLKDVNSVYLSCNDSTARDYKIKAADISGKTDYDFFTRDLADKYRADDRRIMEAGKTEELEENYIQDGKSYFIHTVKTPIKDADGKVIGILGIFWDITERKNLEIEVEEHHQNLEYMVKERTAQLQKINELLGREVAERKSTQELFISLFNSAPSGIYIAQDRRFVFCNPEFTKITGYSMDELKEMDSINLAFPADREMVRDNAIEMLKGLRHVPYEFRYVTKSGNVRWALDINVSINYQGKRAALGHFTDVNDRKQAEENIRLSEEKYRSILEQMHDSYFEADLAGNCTFVNSSMCQVLGYSAQELIGKNFRITVAKEDISAVYEAYNHVYKTGHPNTGFAFRIVRKDGTTAFTEYSISLLKNRQGEAIGFRCVGRDVTERKKLEQKLEEMATHDALTGLPSRVLLNDRLTMALNQIKRKNSKLAVMLLDLDKFKTVNDTLGHTVGDHLLRAVSDRLVSVVRKIDTVARFGGDEFVVLLAEIVNAEESVEIAKRILNSFEEQFILDGNKLQITTSIGIAVSPDDGNDVDTLIKRADAAMYRVKESGRANYLLYNSPGA
jgi:diguanylate cyclase (GGDEF)-like protein/PAS domain S-box-containing protein